MTNYEKIHSMTPEELAKILQCPYDTAGRNNMPCLANYILPNDEMCHKCILKWLEREAGMKLEVWMSI